MRSTAREVCLIWIADGPQRVASAHCICHVKPSEDRSSKRTRSVVVTPPPRDFSCRCNCGRGAQYAETLRKQLGIPARETRVQIDDSGANLGQVPRNDEVNAIDIDGSTFVLGVAAQEDEIEPSQQSLIGELGFEVDRAEASRHFEDIMARALARDASDELVRDDEALETELLRHGSRDRSRRWLPVARWIELHESTLTAASDPLADELGAACVVVFFK